MDVTRQVYVLLETLATLAMAFRALALGSLAECIEVVSDHTDGAYRVGYSLFTMGDWVIAWGFWLWSRTAARTPPK